MTIAYLFMPLQLRGVPSATVLLCHPCVVLQKADGQPLIGIWYMGSRASVGPGSPDRGCCRVTEGGSVPTIWGLFGIIVT